jgi:superoxide reductase
MNKRLDVYKCEKCGNIVEFLYAGPGPLTCCGAPMVLQDENTVDAATEKHVPKIVKLSDGYEVIVGNVKHPMEEKHYIQWIELIVDDIVHTKFLSPGDDPIVAFKTEYGEKVQARAYCNLHGHWKLEL